MKNKNLRFLIPLAVIIFLFPVCTKKSDWVQFRGEGGRGVSPVSINPPLGIRWKIKLQTDSDYELIDSLNPPVVIGNTIYFGSADGNFYALDAESGYMRWIFKSGAEINSVPYVDNEQVYFGSKDGKLYALSRDTGQEIWNFSTNSQINSLVQKYKDKIIFVGDADAIFFLSTDGDEQYRVNNPGWYHYTFLVADDVMYFGTGPEVSKVGPFDINQREFLWWVPFNDIRSSWYSFTAVRGNLLYFGTADGYDGYMDLAYYAFDRRSGRKVWEQQRIGVFSGWQWDSYEIWRYFRRNTEVLDFLAPTIWKDIVIFTGGDTVARAFDAETGAPRWEQHFESPIASPPTIAGSRVYFGLMGDDFNPPRFVCIEAKDGRQMWSMETEGALLSSPVIAGKRIIFGTDKSVFYVLEEVF